MSVSCLDEDQGELAALGTGGDEGHPVPADAGEPQLRAGVRALLETIMRMLFGQPGA